MMPATRGAGSWKNRRLGREERVCFLRKRNKNAFSGKVGFDVVNKTGERLWPVREWVVWFGALTIGILWLGGDGLIERALASPIGYPAWFAWLFMTILLLAFSVVRHAECLAVRLGEPYGTLILTLSVITIEVVMIAAVMLVGKANPYLARDTMFAILMIVLGGMIGVTLIVGGWRHHEQEYNLKGVNAFLSVVIPLSVLGLVLPRFTVSTDDASASPLLAVMLILMSIGLYAVFLGMQTIRHRHFFTQPDGENHEWDEHTGHGPIRSIGYHTTFLILSMLPVVLLAKNLAVFIDHAIAKLGAPPEVGGVLVAILVLAPEGLSALHAAWENRLQRTVNLCFGSALATICLTIPAVLVVGFVTGQSVQLGLANQELVLLTLTLVLSIVTFGSGRTNVLQGAVHLIVFIAYVVLIFDFA